MPAIASTHAALRRSSSRVSCDAALEPLARALGLEAHQRATAARARRRVAGASAARERGQRARRRVRARRATAEAPQVLAGQVHATVRAASSRTSRRMFVSCSATPRSSASRSARARSAAGVLAQPEDREAHAPDRAGDAAAVDDELVEALVAWCPRRPCARPRSARRARPAAVAKRALRVRERDHHRIRRPPAPRGCPARCAASAPRLRRRAGAASPRGASVPSPMSSTRRANAYTAHIARRRSAGSRRIP